MDIAFLTPNIHRGTASLIWPRMCRSLGGDRLFIFAGGRLGALGGHEIRYNRLYEYAGKADFDGAISWVSALGGNLSVEGIRRAHENLFPMPLVAVGSRLPGSPSLTIDAYAGMTELLRHFHKSHGCRRFAFIRGPAGHESADERYRAFLDFVRNHGLDPLAQHVPRPADWIAASAAVRELLDGDVLPGRDYEALIASSDLQAYDSALLLRERGYEYPEHYLLGGFNNSPESRLLSPAFTTVQMPFEQVGVRALEMLISGEGDAEPLRTRLIIRKSCGCFTAASSAPGSIKLKAPGAAPESGHDGEDPPLMLLEKDMLEGIQGGDDERRLYARPLAAALLRSISAGSPPAFLGTLERTLESMGSGNQSLFVWQDALSAAHRRCRQLYGSSGETGFLIEALFEQARVLVSDAGEKQRALESWSRRQVMERLQDFEHALWSFVNLEHLAPILAEYLPGLGIHSAYVIATDGASPRLICSLQQGRGHTHDRPLVAGALLPPEVRSSLPAGSAWIVLPLADEDAWYGHLILSSGQEDGGIYEQVRMSITGAMRNYVLLDKIRHARDQARKAEEVKTRFLFNAGQELQAPVEELLRMSSEIDPPLPARFRRKFSVLYQLTRDLGDFSRVQAEDLELSLAVLDIRQTLGQLYPAMTLEAAPLIHGDRQRLVQMLQGLCRLLGGDASAPRAARLDYGAEGVRLELHFPAQGSSVSGEGGGVSLDLYRRIMILHGGSLEFPDASPGDDGRILRLGLRFPYPAFSGGGWGIFPGGKLIGLGFEPQEDGQQSGSGADSVTAALRSGLERLAQKFGAGLRVPGTEDFSGFDGHEAGGLVFNALSSDIRHWRMLMRLRASGLAEGAVLLVFPEDLAGVQASESRDLWTLLLSGRTASLAGPVVVIRNGVIASGECFPRDDQDCFELEGGSDFALFPRDQAPRVLVLGGPPSGDFLGHLRLRNWTSVPRVIVARDFSPLHDAQEEGPEREWLIHQGVFSPHEFRQFLEDLPERGGMYNSQTLQMLRRAIIHIDLHWAQAVSRWQIAEAVHVSEDYFTRVFHREMGISPWDYLIRLRMARAAVILRESGHSIQEVARRSGYADQAYFCRVFRKTLGMTPSRYRRQWSEA